MACALGAAVHEELGFLVGQLLTASRSAAAAAVAACGGDAPLGSVDLGAELSVQLDALKETSDAFESGLAVDSAETRSRVSEALRYLIPLAASMLPSARATADEAAGVEQRVRLEIAPCGKDAVKLSIVLEGAAGGAVEIA